MKKGGDKLGSAIDKITGNTPAATAAPAAAVVAPAATVAGGVDVSNLDDFQKAGVKKIQGNQSLLEDIANYPKQA